MIKTFMDIAPLAFTLVPLLCFHFETKSLVSALSFKLESVWFSLENLD